MSSYADFIRQMIERKKNREKAFYDMCGRRSVEYMGALRLVFEDLGVLYGIAQEKEPDAQETDNAEELPGGFSNTFTRVASRSPEFLAFEVDGETFYMIVENVVEPPNGSMRPMIMAFCASNNELNNDASENYNYFNIVPEEWHQKILDHLKNQKIDLISDG